jgi:hypothetical protein
MGNSWKGKQNERCLKDIEFSRELYAALARATAAKPRPGIEDRILANLRSAQERNAERWAWRWPLAASLAALIVAATFVAWSPRWRSRVWSNNFSLHAPQNQQTNAPVRPQVSNEAVVAAGHGAIPPRAFSGRRRKVQAVSFRSAKVAATPKLDQFPSPEPLSEQEKMLTVYIAEHHRQAVLLARDHMAQLKQDLAEETEALGIENPTRDEPGQHQDR